MLFAKQRKQTDRTADDTLRFSWWLMCFRSPARGISIKDAKQFFPGGRPKNKNEKTAPKGQKTPLKRDLCKMYRGRKFGPKNIHDAQNDGPFFVRMTLNAPRRIIRRGVLFFGRRNIVARRVKNARIPCKIRERRRSGNRREKALFRPVHTGAAGRRCGGGKNGGAGGASKLE